MRKSSFGVSGGRPSMSGEPLRIRNSNTNNAGSSKRSTTSGKVDCSSFGQGARKSTGVQSRMSFLPKTGRASSGIGVRGRTDVTKDPRPLSDKRYQRQCIKQLLEFLTNNNYAEAISLKLLVSPTSKDFFKIFEFIYGQLNPGYKNVPKMEEEVPHVLKMLGYPITLSKTYLFSVGSPHTWPHLCAALCWMIELVQFADSTQSEGIDNYIFESAADSDFDGISAEKISFDYRASTYAAFMSGADDFLEQNVAVQNLLKKRYQGDNLETLVEEYKRMESQLQLIEQAEERSCKLRDKTAIIKQDTQKTQAFVNELERYKMSLVNEHKERDEACRSLSLELESEKARVAEMQAIYQHQELTPYDVERLRTEQNSLRNQVDQLERLLEDNDSDNWKLNMKISNLNEKVEKAVATYNRLANELKLVPETAEFAKGKDFRLRAGFSADIVGHFENNIKPMLKMMKNHYKGELRRKNKEEFQLQLEQEQLQESVTERREIVAQKKKELASIEAEIESMKQLFATDKKSFSEELDVVQNGLTQSEASVNAAKAELLDAQAEHMETLQLVEAKKESIQEEMADLEMIRKETTQQIDDHKESIKRQLLAFLGELKAADELMDGRVLQAESLVQTTMERINKKKPH